MTKSNESLDNVSQPDLYNHQKVNDAISKCVDVMRDMNLNMLECFKVAESIKAASVVIMAENSDAAKIKSILDESGA